MKARDKATVISEIKALVKEISSKCDAMPDCGGLQGAAVLHAFPELRKRMNELGNEAESLGISQKDLMA